MVIFNIRKILKDKVVLLIFSLLSIVIILSIIIYTLSMKSGILRGTKIGNILEKLDENKNILNMQSYYAEFEVTIKSNKNTNTYSMKEWYKKDIGNRVEYIDSTNSKVNIITLDNKVIIKNCNQKNIMTINPYITRYTNLLSLSTFVNIYNKNLKKACCFKASSYEKENNINMILDSVCKMGANCNCDESEIVKEVSYIELKLNKKSGLPITYIVYNNDKKESISIVYNKFDINVKLSDNTFEI